MDGLILNMNELHDKYIKETIHLFNDLKFLNGDVESRSFSSLYL